MNGNDQLMQLLGQLASIGNAAKNEPKASAPAPGVSGLSDNDSDYEPEARFSPRHEEKTLSGDFQLPSDSSQINTYSAALKYIVCVLIPKDSQFIDWMRTLMEEQKSHEQQWVEGAEALRRKQELRKSGRAELANVLKILGADKKNNQENDKDIARDNLREMDMYYRNVYRQQEEFVKYACSRLAELKVPLFCIDAGMRTPHTQRDQRRLLEFLQDLCGDDDGNDTDDR